MYLILLHSIISVLSFFFPTYYFILPSFPTLLYPILPSHYSVHSFQLPDLLLYPIFLSFSSPTFNISYPSLFQPSMVSYPSPSQPSVLSYPILSVSFPNFCSILFFFSFPIYYFILSFRSFYTIISFSFLTSTFQPSTPLFPSLSNLFCSSLLEYVSNIYTLVLNKYFTFYLFHVATNNGHILQIIPQQSLDNILNPIHPYT